MVALLDNFERAVEIRVVAARNIHQRIGVSILAPFIGNVGHCDGAASHRMIQLVHREYCVGDGWFVIDRNYVYGRRVFHGRIVACAGTDNLVLECCVTVAEFIGLGLVSELAKICNINDLVFGNGCSIVCERSGSREI